MKQVRVFAFLRQNNGLCVQTTIGFTCQCLASFTGSLCDKIIDTCVDTQTSCAQYASYCYLLVNVKPHPCPKTCKVCSPTITTPAPCIDRSTSCTFWAKYCYLLTNTKPHPCAKTCKTC